MAKEGTESLRSCWSRRREYQNEYDPKKIEEYQKESNRWYGKYVYKGRPGGDGLGWDY